MRFSGLKISNQKYLIGDIERIENKQRISLSSHAYSTLLHDLDVFQPFGVKQGELSSEFLNQIFQNYQSCAESSIAESLHKKRDHLLTLLSGMADASAKNEAINLLIDEYAAKLEQNRKRRTKDKDASLLFRVSKDNLRFLLSDEGQQEAPFYRDDIGGYFKALLEEYCEQPFIIREQIYNRNSVDEINTAIDKELLLKITTRKHNISYVKPLALEQDTERLYNYLIGLKSTSREGPWEIGSIRLSSISSCKRQERSGFIRTEEKKEIRNAIKQTGIQYISGHDTFQRIIVELTTEGERMYRSILHLRPRYARKVAEHIYEFHCSIKQAENYFYTFGHNARIREPVFLADMFSRKYKNAAKRYE